MLSVRSLVGALAPSLILAAAVGAQTTSSSLNIGGPGSFGCQGTNEPALLDDGSAATGTIGYTYDESTRVLRLVVTNTSEVQATNPNPLITDIWVNVPAFAVTDAQLIGQSGSGGATPAFTMIFDADNHHAPTLAKADCVGDFSIRLSAGGLAGGIGNAAASVFAIPAGQVVTGPATFDIQLTTNGTVNAASFTNWMSTNARMTPRMAAAMTFNGAGVGGAGAGIIGHSVFCKTGFFTVGETRLGNTFDFHISGPECCHLCIWGSLNPGPTSFMGYTIELGFPLFGVFDMGFLPREQDVSVQMTVPNNRSLLGLTMYWVNATYMAGHEAETLDVSQQFKMVITN